MVSWQICFPISCLILPAICSGDQQRRSFSSTYAKRTVSENSFFVARFDTLLHLHAVRCAFLALYPLRPPFLENSRLTVEGGMPSRSAISRCRISVSLHISSRNRCFRLRCS